MGSTNIFPAPGLISAPKLSASKGLRFRVGALVFHSGLDCRASGIRVKGLGFRAWAKSIPPILLAPQYGVTGALILSWYPCLGGGLTQGLGFRLQA